MRILILTATYTPSINGVAVTAALQKRELEKRGHSVKLIAPRHPKQKKEKGVIRLLSFSNPIYKDYPLMLPLPSLLIYLILREEFDLVFFHHPFYLGDISLYLARRYKSPAVFFYHSHYSRYITTFSSAFPLNLVSDQVSKSVYNTITKSNHLIVETDSVKKILTLQGIFTPFSVIPSVRESMFMQNQSKSKLRKKYGLSQDKLIILCVARLSREKNLDSLLKIIGKINLKIPFTLCLVGEGPEEQYLRNLASFLKISESCQFLGAIEHNKIAEFYTLADIFAYPSKLDTQACVILEALSAGLPVVSFNVPGPKDFISHEKNGLLANSDLQFNQQLKKLMLNTKIRMQMGKEALLSSQKYSLKKSIDDLENLFEKLVSKTSE
ncbi:hypothetical protein A3C98_03775 [Candidatus Roizmanbacteria bacterium RIFCSPHIGHO2_02_FULL_37_15]|uniref:Glycosyl transferase family 1 domain-containing protein n=1 Tax=Candidatus Roizmanbacteria bacterium RIFCSPLOWO2_01_FULL_37_16 TaxID=1802058 RepID=A0A1F7IKM2_9BACT|nr:MAG: hypothetical protein A2859_04960 [Candidatus Roizmanbacteria bacterium RIFCSPHIGHO2_01_FULL_37_16b]OGK21991.1 MAG: hypothetical protein A3C98_03775 [Candidatus Roizmanbacteria bacterium RIFCSPHIGHO2_02_FULL_37_15]OGK31752.1 MAG: hypothetical protein A3F57_00180 [Candidatus Roizmanbacteria bacterium RIFCSPHIGHO2_12_FULL_36_11]OGK43912.1 MAG: hypothetical protein A3B40_03815 [Candidatus Roizmanbacteria bacterium RIFCSPLOWO2_01_FULL_37_16]